jgi:hypothetical protein
MSVHPFRQVHDDALRNIVPACTGNCGQDSRRYPNRDACQLPVEETPLGLFGKVKRWFLRFVADVETWR